MDLVGKRFGRQVVLRDLGDGQVEIQCDCGRRKRTRKQYIVDGQSKSCGCGRYASKFVLSAGDRFFRLVVVKHLGTNGNKREVLVKCDCGTHKVVQEPDLHGGSVKSCGCLRRQRTGRLNFKHGSTKTPIHRMWLSMWERTRRSDRYPSYARAGIEVADDWKDFVKFRDYVEKELGPRPKGMSLDRVDNAKGYEPGNVRWSSAKQQARNRSSNTTLAIRGETKCLAAWSETSGIAVSTICARRRQGWSDEDAVFVPLKR